MIRKVIIYILYGVSITSILLASGAPQVANWWDIARPYFVVWFIATIVALGLSYIDQIRRVTYPAIVCFSAWAYNHKIILTKFTKNTYRVYKLQDKSYRKLFTYTQDLFDIYLDHR